MKIKLQEKFEKIEGWWRLFDIDKSGKINEQELRKLLNHAGIYDRNNLELVLNRFERDSDGFIAKEEFLKELNPVLKN